MSKPPKIDRKTLKAPDEFVKKGRGILGFLIEKKFPFLAVLGAVAAVVLIVYGYDWWSERQLLNAWTAYGEVLKKPESERWDRLKDFVGKYSRTRPMVFAAASLADHYFEERKKELAKSADSATSQNFALALEWYDKALSFRDLLPLERQLLHLARGKAYETEKKNDEALSDFQKAADLGSDARALALLNVSRLKELKGDVAGAKESFLKVTVEFPNSEYARQAKVQLRRLGSPLFSKE
ncbi:MAG: hypothetical protein HY537_15815 [Deltaproteobacteria bacterium]|nr:hypothetical protein [Deltaproteobacteria bacterium]